MMTQKLAHHQNTIDQNSQDSSGVTTHQVAVWISVRDVCVGVRKGMMQAQVNTCVNAGGRERERETCVGGESDYSSGDSSGEMGFSHS